MGLVARETPSHKAMEALMVGSDRDAWVWLAIAGDLIPYTVGRFVWMVHFFFSFLLNPVSHVLRCSLSVPACLAAESLRGDVLCAILLCFHCLSLGLPGLGRERF